MTASAICKVLCVSSVFVGASGADPDTPATEYPAGYPCAQENVTVLLKAPDWPGKCLDLRQVTDDAIPKFDAVTCKQKCLAMTDCSVWQLTKAPDNFCYVADSSYKARGCWGRDDDDTFVPVAAERLQRGVVKVTKTLPTNTWVPGLYKVGKFPTPGADAAGEPDRCRKQCQSDINCGKWLYVKDPTPADLTGAKEAGCYVQTKGDQIGTDEQLPAGQLSEGETITHTCHVPYVPPPKKEEGMPLWAIIGLILLGVLLLLLLAGLLYYCFFMNKPGPPKKTRAVKVAPKKEKQEVLQPLVPMPVVQQPMVAYVAAPTVVTPTTTATYQAVPQAAPTVYTSAPIVQSVAAVPQITQVPQVASTLQQVPQVSPEMRPM